MAAAGGTSSSVPVHKEMAAAHPGACGRARSRCLTTRPPLAQPVWELWSACHWGQSTKPQAEEVPHGNFQKQPEPQHLPPAFLSALKWRWPQRSGKRGPVPSLWHSHTAGPQEGAMVWALCVCRWAGRGPGATAHAGGQRERCAVSLPPCEHGAPRRRCLPLPDAWRVLVVTRSLQVKCSHSQVVFLHFLHHLSNVSSPRSVLEHQKRGRIADGRGGTLDSCKEKLVWDGESRKNTIVGGLKEAGILLAEGRAP